MSIHMLLHTFLWGYTLQLGRRKKMTGSAPGGHRKTEVNSSIIYDVTWTDTVKFQDVLTEMA